MALSRRVEVLFSPEQYELLEEIARNRKESLGGLLRKAAERMYLQGRREEKREAIERLLSDESDLGVWEDVKRDLEAYLYGQIERSMGNMIPL